MGRITNEKGGADSRVEAADNHVAIVEEDVLGDVWDGSWLDGCSEYPAIGHHTIDLIDEAVRSIVLARAPVGYRVLPTLSALTSLALEVDCRFHDAVADARDFGYGWEIIATRLGISARSARRRYGSYARWRATIDFDRD